MGKILDEIASNPEKYYWKATRKLYSPDVDEEDVEKYAKVRAVARQYLDDDYEFQLRDKILTDEYREKIESEPEELYKKLYEKINDESLTDEQYAFLSTLKNATEYELLKDNVDPEELVRERTAVGKFFNNVFKTLNVPVNMVTTYLSDMGVANPDESFELRDLSLIDNLIDPEQRKELWDTTGYSSLIRDSNLQTYDGTFEDSTLGDSPINYSEILEKEAYDVPLTEDEERASKILKGVETFGGLALDIAADPGDAIFDLLGNSAKSIRGIRTLGLLNYFDEVSDIIKNTSMAIKNADVSDDVAKVADEILSLEKADSKTVNAIISKSSLQADNIDDLVKLTGNKNISNAWNVGKGWLKKVAEVQSNPATKRLNRIIDWTDNKIKKPIGEWLDQVPVFKTLRKAFKSDVPTAYKGAFDQRRYASQYLTSKGKRASEAVDTMVKQYAKERGLELDTAKRFISEAVEGGSRDGMAQAIAEKIRNIQAELLLDEVRYGVPVKPLGVNSDEWITKVDEYRNLITTNPTHPKISELEDYIKRSSKLGTKAEDLFENIDEAENIQYLTHVLTDEAKEYLNAFMKASSGKGGDIAHASTRARKLKDMTIEDVNKLLREGSEKAIKDNLGDFWLNFKKAHPNADFFSSDPVKLIRTRFNRASYAVGNAVLKDELLKLKTMDKTGSLISDSYTKGYQLITIGGEKIGFAPKEVADAVYKIQQFASPTVWKNIVNTYDKILTGLRRITLLPFPKYHLRNEIGNVITMMMAGWRPVGKGLKSAGDAGRILRAMDLADVKILKNLEFVTDSGRIYRGTDIADMILRSGLIDTGEVGQTIGAKTGTLKKALLDIQTSTGTDKLKTILKKINPFGQDSILMNVGGKVGGAIENHAKVTLYLDQLIKGVSPQDAANTVRKYLFDYSDLTTFESQYIKRLAYFYTWFRKNLALQFNNLFNPVNRALMKSVNAMNQRDKVNVTDNRYQSDWLKNTPTVTLSEKRYGKGANLWSLENFIPFYELAKPIRATSGGEFWQESVSLLNPLVKTGPELFFNYDTFTNKPIEDYSGEKVNFWGTYMPAKLEHTIKNFLRAGSQMERSNPGAVFGDDENLSVFGYARSTPDFSASQKWWDFLLGKPLKYDTQFSKILESNDASSDLYDKMSNIYSEIIRLKSNYKGNELPRNDIIRIVELLRETQDDMQYQLKRGTISRSDDSRLFGYFESLINSLKELTYEYQ